MKYFLMVLIFLSYRYIQATCPSLCNQNSCTYGFLFCVDTGLEMIPENPPPKTTQVIIKNQLFKNPVLGYRNLSGYGTEEINLKLLTIQNCGLTEIESESFSHLIHLTEMDLSFNQLQTINPKTFKALNLKSLKLDGNRLLQLTSNSFQGLVVSSLSLGNCGLGNLEFDSIKEISGHLVKFNLADNDLKSLNSRFYLLFKRLEEIRLEGNRLKCDCRIKWLNNIFKLNKHSDNPLISQITCFYPSGMRGKIISDLEESNFICPKPDLKAISVDLSTKSAVLYCSSTPNSDTQVVWQMRNSENNSLFKFQQLLGSRNNASIKIKKTTTSDRFSCVVSNENGNVSVDLNIRWPEDNSNITKESINPVLIFSKSNNSSKSIVTNQINYLYIKQFTFLEMIISIGSTFIVTTITFSLIYLCLSRRLNISIGKQSPCKIGYQGGVYSDTQIYDSPRYSSPHKSFQQSAQLIDFKTQKPITQDIH